jgi:hypothetical protein
MRSVIVNETRRWAIGPTGVVLRQDGPRTVGVLANQLWSVAGESNRASVNATFVQPFVTYVTQTRTTFALNTESTYDWQRNQRALPINFRWRNCCGSAARSCRWVPARGTGPMAPPGRRQAGACDSP